MKIVQITRDKEIRREAEREYTDAFESLLQDAEAYHAKLVTVMIDCDPPTREYVKDLCLRHSVLYCESNLSCGADPDKYQNSDGHFNGAGNSLLAGEVYGFLSKHPPDDDFSRAVYGMSRDASR